MKERAKTPNAPWAVRLQNIVEDIRTSALAAVPFRFSAPKLLPGPKGNNEYRPISAFVDVNARIIDSLSAKYLREALDCTFEDASVAFRAPRKRGDPPLDRHSAFDDIYAMRARHSGSLHVAECDIRGFYDCVDHEIARMAIKSAVSRAEITNPKFTIDSRALLIFESYLDCYSFQKNVREQWLPELRKNPDFQNAKVKWPEDCLAQLHGPRFIEKRIGVPQGGALSCLISNLVLDSADKEVRRSTRNAFGEILYRRYCDDMIIVSDTRSACCSAYLAYLSSLKSLKLPCHPPKPVFFYSRLFWEGKSNAPYRWSGIKWLGCSPWIQFLGYQLRYDGLVRVRPKSISKHFEKVCSETDKVIGIAIKCVSRSTVHHRLTKRKSQVIFRLKQKLISVSVGRRNKGDYSAGPKTMCWASGYAGLHKRPHVFLLMRRFDRHRRRQVSRLSKRLKSVAATGHPSQLEADLPRYFGHAYSYSGQFDNTGSWDRIKNPKRTNELQLKLYRYLEKNWADVVRTIAESFDSFSEESIDRYLASEPAIVI